MGARLVGQAIAVALPELRTNAARVVLLAMAHMAHDTDRQPCYFAGWEYMAGVLGYDTATDAGRDSGRRAYARAVRELRAAGLVTYHDPQQPRSHKRRLRLTLPGP